MDTKDWIWNEFRHHPEMLLERLEKRFRQSKDATCRWNGAVIFIDYVRETDTVVIEPDFGDGDAIVMSFDELKALVLERAKRERRQLM